MKRPAKIGLALAVLAGGVVAFRVWSRPRPIEVAVRTVDRGLVEETVANTRAGTVKACRRAALALPFGGQVARLPVRKGDRVVEGQVLLELENSELRAHLSLAERETEAAAARAEQACLSAEHAAREAARIERLHAEGIADSSALDRTQSERETARAACNAARAGIEEARAGVAVANAALEKTLLRAPIGGVIAELNAELGEVVIPTPPGIPTRPAVDLIEQGCLYVVAPLDEVDAPRVRVGQPARVVLDAFPGRTLPGHVRDVAPYVLEREKQARTVDVEVELERPEELPELVPGYSADVEVLLDAREDVLRMPTEALAGDGRVLVLQNGRLESRTVDTGLSNWQYTEVRSGLAQGDEVVVSLDRAGVTAGVAAAAEVPPAGAGG